MMISHVTYDSNNDIKMPPRMPKIITILARIENRLDAVIMYYAIAALMFSPIFVLFGPRIKAYSLKKSGK